MKSVTLREMRHNFQPILTQLEAGESLQISRRGKIIAILSPPPVEKKKPRKRKDFMARFLKIYGPDWRDRAPSQNSVVRERELSRW